MPTVSLSLRRLQTAVTTLAHQFIKRFPSAAHLREDLEQEAAAAFLTKLPDYREGDNSIEAFLWPYGLKAMQSYLARAGGVVNRPRGHNTFESADYGEMPVNVAGNTTPADHLELKQAASVMAEFIEARLPLTNTRLPMDKARDMMTQLSLGESFVDVGADHGESKQRLFGMYRRLNTGRRS